MALAENSFRDRRFASGRADGRWWESAAQALQE